MQFRILFTAIALLLPVSAADVRERLTRLVPPSDGKEQPEFYDANSLYQYMDGAADVFQLYDVQSLFHRDFKSGAADLTIDLFDMGTPENAFGMYAAERSPRYIFITVGAEGYRNEGILNFFQDRYYVKLAGFGDGADAALQKLAVEISAKIGGNRAFPALLDKLPRDKRNPRTEKYLRKDPLGHPFLSPAWQAQYGDSTLMVSVAPNAADAATRLKSLESHFRQTGTWKPSPDFGANAAQGSNSFEGTLVAANAGHYVVILLNPTAASAALFQEAAARLK